MLFLCCLFFFINIKIAACDGRRVNIFQYFFQAKMCLGKDTGISADPVCFVRVGSTPLDL